VGRGNYGCRGKVVGNNISITKCSQYMSGCCGWFVSDGAAFYVRGFGATLVTGGRMLAFPTRVGAAVSVRPTIMDGAIVGWDSGFCG